MISESMKAYQQKEPPQSLLLRYRNPDALMLVYKKRFPRWEDGQKQNEKKKEKIRDHNGAAGIPSFCCHGRQS
jgi:hypothetical protein